MVHRYEEKYINTCIGRRETHAERRKELKIGNPVGRRAEVLDQEAQRAERQENLEGMGDMRRRMVLRERVAMAAADKQR